MMICSLVSITLSRMLTDGTSVVRVCTPYQLKVSQYVSTRTSVLELPEMDMVALVPHDHEGIKNLKH